MSAHLGTAAEGGGASHSRQRCAPHPPVAVPRCAHRRLEKAHLSRMTVASGRAYGLPGLAAAGVQPVSDEGEGDGKDTEDEDAEETSWVLGGPKAIE